jgi:transcriptional regulator with XRE-family HTH domain
MTGDAPAFGAEAQSTSRLDNRDFRASCMEHGLRAYLADQIRALRGNRSQREFGRLIGKPQSVVSRLENEDYGKLTLQTMLDIAEKLDIALIVRFADFPTFLRTVADAAPETMAPAGYEDNEAGHRQPASLRPNVSAA